MNAFLPAMLSLTLLGAALCAPAGSTAAAAPARPKKPQRRPAEQQEEAAAALPRIAGPWVELRKSPLFQSPTLPLARTWGPALPPGTGFSIEKVYGRWLYGKPQPLAYMRAADFAPSGWIFSRMLLLPGDLDTLPPALTRLQQAVLFHARAIPGKGSPALDFLDSLVLSRNTLASFSRPEPASGEAPPGAWRLFPDARAEEEAPQLGLTGAELEFLRQEIRVIQAKKQKEVKLKEARRRKPPAPPPIDDKVRSAVLGRYMLERYLELPPLSMEEIDGHIYLRATALRALRGCPKKIQDHWAGRRWSFFRVYRLKSRPETRHPWFEVALPGGAFAVSGRAIELAGNEAELAFLLVRQLVRELRSKRESPRFSARQWPGELEARAERAWDQVLKAQSTREGEGIDVADEIAADVDAVECLARAGYRAMAGISYLRRLALHREQPWAAWFARHAIGLDYRIERSTALVQQALARQQFPEGRDSQARRFASAARQWNLLP